MSDETIRVLKQDYHRNGVGGAGFVVSLFEWDPDEVGKPSTFLGISFFPDADYPPGRRAAFITHTGVIDLNLAAREGVIEFGHNSWRGSDHVGPVLATAWEQQENEPWD